MTIIFESFLIIIVCLFLSAFFAMTETAVLSISNPKAKHLKELNGVSANVLDLWINNPSRMIVALLIANNLINIFVSIYVENLVHDIFGTANVFYVSLGMTFVIVFFAEVIPKTFAKNFAYIIVIPVLNIFQFFYFILYPLTTAMAKTSDVIQNFLLKKWPKSVPDITQSELAFLINYGEEEGVIQTQEHGMLSAVFELGETLVREIMVHRTDLVALNQNTPIIEAVDKFKEAGLSRIPIYEEKIDNIIGTVHVKDALFFIKKNQHESAEFFKQNTVIEIKRDCLFVPESKPVDQLFQEMRRAKQHLAVVLDEYGGTSGLVTMEDIFEEIVGEVRDEFDNEEDTIKPTQVPNQYLVDCKIHIDDFCDFFDLETAKLKENYSDDLDTLAGLIINHFGLIPKHLDKFVIDNISIEIIEVSKRRVRRVIVNVEGNNEK